MVEQDGTRDEVIRFKKKTRLKGYVLGDSPMSGDSSSGIVTPIGVGGSGVVFYALQELYKDVAIPRALKFFMYRDDIAQKTLHRHRSPISIEEFVEEITNITKFSHEHLVKVVDAGVYTSDAYEIPFIVMEYVDGPNLRDIIEYNDSGTGTGQASDIRRRFGEDPVSVLTFLIRMGWALKHIHDKGFAHCDIAPKNVFVSCDDEVKPKIGDLGTARNLGLQRNEVFVIGSRDYMPPRARELLETVVPWENFVGLQPEWDIFGFAKTAQELANSLDLDPRLPWKLPLESSIKEALSGTKYPNIHDLITRLEFLLPIHRELAAVPELSASAARRSRKLMPVESLATSARIRDLIQHPALLRLGRVPQLTTVYQLFPGANHTRYEHSLGVMETVRRYIIALLDQSEFLVHLSTKKIELALICGLLSNMTRFPLSNVIHELRRKGPAILDSFSKETLFEEVLQIKNKRGQAICEVIDFLFNGFDDQRMKDILMDRKQTFEAEDHFVYSLLNCSLDARVIDFVRRDSLHLGLIKGDTFALEELLPHLTVHSHRLALRARGVTIAEQIIALRYWLFNRIYWNWPNRSFSSMVRHVFLELGKDGPAFLNRMREAVLHSTDTQILKLMLHESEMAKRDDLIDVMNLLAGDDQVLFKVVLEASPKERAELRVVCRRIGEFDYAEMELLARKIAENVPSIKKHNKESQKRTLVLVDMPYEPGGRKLGEDMMVIRPDGGVVDLMGVSGIISGIYHSFDEYLRHLRVMIHPEIYPSPGTDRRDMQREIVEYLTNECG